MKKYTISFLSIALGVFLLFTSSVQAAVSSSQSIILSPGWNIVSTPKVLDSHTFSVAETSDNFDIYALDPSKASGWITLADLGQTEFTPLYGYFVNNKTGTNQTLTFNFSQNLSPNQKLFSRTFANTGWYTFGVANPSYVLPVGFSSGTDTNNPEPILSGMSGYYDSVVDFTDGLFSSNPDTTYASTTWKSAVASDIYSLHDFRETKGYGIFINKNGGLYSGMQSDPAPISDTISITNSPAVPAQNIAINTPNQPLGGFTTNISGEPILVQSMDFYVATSSTGGGLITSVTLVDQNGTVIAGPANAMFDSASGQQKIHFSSTVVFQTSTNNYTIKGKLPLTFANGGTIQVSSNPSSDWGNAMGQTTGNAINLSGNGLFTMNIMTTKASTIQVNISAQPISQIVVVGAQNFVFANYQLDATLSGEDVRLSSFPVTISSDHISDLTGCVLFNGSTQLNTGSRVINTITSGVKTTFSLDSSLTIPKGTVVTLSLQCNVSSSATATNYQVMVNSTAGDYNMTGVVSGNTVVPTFGNGNGGIMTPHTGSLTVSIDPSSPSYAIVAGGSTGNNAGVIKFHASNEGINLTKVGLILTSGSASDINQVYLYQGSTLVGTVVFPQGINVTATSTLTSPLNLPKDTDVLLTIKADMAGIGTAQSGTEGQLVKIDPINAEGYGISSGNTIRAGGVIAGVSGVRTFRSFPTLTLDSMSSTGIADGHLMRFKVTANSSGPIGISQFKFIVATSTANVNNVNLFVYTDSAYSNPISGQQSGGQISQNNISDLTSGTAFAITPQTNPIQVPAGTTYYFELRGSISGVQTGSAVITTLLGDSSYNGITNAFNAVGNFIWSGDATTTQPFSGIDWSNGYGVWGLPSSGIIQTRSN